MHDNYDLRQEQMNKSSLLSSRKFLGTLLEIFTTHVVSKTYYHSDQVNSEEDVRDGGWVGWGHSYISVDQN